jgi:hypothetical protein
MVNDNVPASDLAVSQFVQTAGGESATIRDRLALLTVPGMHGEWRWSISWSEDGLLLCMRSALDVVIPETRRLAVAEYASLANCRLVVGAVYVDMNDGEAGFRIGRCSLISPFTLPELYELAVMLFSGSEAHLPFVRPVSAGVMPPQEASAIAVARTWTDEVDDLHRPPEWVAIALE